MKTKHTPGPWWIDDSEFIAAGSDGTYKTIADPCCMEPTPDNMPEMEANAFLISKAPELLQALSNLVSYLGPDWANDPEVKEAKKLLKQFEK